MSKNYVRRVQSKLGRIVCEAPLGRPQEPSIAAGLLRRILQTEAVEVFGVLLLDGKHNVSGWAEVSRGTLTASLVHPREVFGPAIRMGAAAIIVAHNHPSGDPSPSLEDFDVTERLRQASELLGIPMVDHIIVGAGQAYSSFRQLGKLH